jgi:hypothetical protein
MQRIYLLLRDNKQSGPHTLEELLSMNMKNTDLVWIEGRSMGWAFPAEIEALRPFLPEAEGKSPPMETSFPKNERPGSKIFVSLPKETSPDHSRSNWEERTEINRNTSFEKQDNVPLINNYSKSLDEVENHYTSWVVRNHKKKKTISGKRIALGAVLVIGSFGGWLLADMAFSNTTKLGSKITSAQPSTRQMAMETDNTNTGTEENIIESIKEDPNSIKTAPVNSIPDQKKKKAPLKSKPVIKNEIPILIEKPQPGVEHTRSKEVNTIENPETTPELNPEEKPIPEKKRSLKEKISDWVKGGRELGKSSSPEEKVLLDISDDVRVRVDKDPSDWMMGVKGQRLVFSNHSNYTLNTAIVELLYYSEEKSLLDKKRLEISGVAKGKSKSVSIPDHKMADHVEAIVAHAKGDADQKR